MWKWTILDAVDKENFTVAHPDIWPTVGYPDMAYRNLQYMDMDIWILDMWTSTTTASVDKSCPTAAHVEWTIAVHVDLVFCIFCEYGLA